MNVSAPGRLAAAPRGGSKPDRETRIGFGLLTALLPLAACGGLSPRGGALAPGRLAAAIGLAGPMALVGETRSAGTVSRHHSPPRGGRARTWTVPADGPCLARSRTVLGPARPARPEPDRETRIGFGLLTAPLPLAACGGLSPRGRALPYGRLLSAPRLLAACGGLFPRGWALAPGRVAADRAAR